MLGFFKSLFSKGDGKKTAPTPTAKPASAPSKPAAPSPASAAPTALPKPAPPKPAAQPAGPVETTAIHLQAVLAKLPAELKDSVKSPPGAKITIPISTQTILEQMPSGVVKISFGILRSVAPAGTFTDDASHDETPVSIPLPEIMASLNPALLKRRAVQKKVDVPDDVTGLFHKGDRPAAPPPSGGAAPPASAPSQPAAAKPSAPPSAPPAPKAPAPVAAPTPPPPTAPKPSEAPGTVAVSPALREMMAAATAAAKPPAPAPAPVPRPPPPPPPAVPKPPAPPTSAPVPKPPSPPSAPAPATAPVAADVGDLSVPLSDVSKSWPETVQAEMASLKMGSTLSLPTADLGAAIRAGKVVFTWKQLRGWIKPVSITAASGEDNASLTLPLSVIVPLFMAKSQPAKAQRKAAFDENIPDMFVPGKAAAAPAAPPAGTAPAGGPPGSVAPPPPPAPPVTPIESVQKACSLPGVSGALLVSQDGFLVANQLPPTVKGEVVAAFVPQIFGRMSQYTKEMNLGELTALTLVVENVPWQLCKTGNLYFAVLGRAGESLPSAQLNPIAAEIGRQNKQ